MVIILNCVYANLITSNMIMITDSLWQIAIVKAINAGY